MAEPNPRSSVSIIIPTLDEGVALRATIESARSSGPQAEIVVVDGGSSDETFEIAESTGCDIIHVNPPQRARQMNAGARAAHGEILLFLHADTQLPTRALSILCEAMLDQDVVGGAFARRFDSASKFLAMTCLFAEWRNRLWGWHLGDQAMFVRASVFRRLGGFTEVGRFEDLDFSRRLVRHGRLATLHPPVVSSARRFTRRGALRTTLRDLMLTARYLMHGIEELPR